MAQPRKEGLETLGLRLHKDAILKVKMIALERGMTASEIAAEALSQWWEKQPESKTRGPLFPVNESEEEAPDEPTKTTKKAAAAKEASATNPRPTKAPAKKGAKQSARR